MLQNRPQLHTRPDGLRAQRLAHAWTQADLATKAGLSHILVRKMETGERSIHPGTIRKLCAALECEPDDISRVTS